MGSTNASVLTGLAELVAARSVELEDIAAGELPFPRSVVREDITLAIRRMHALADITLEDRCPIGTVALALPGNAILSNPLAAIGASYLTGNHTVVRLPSIRRRWAEVLAGLLREVLPAGAVTMPDLGGRAFIEKALRDPEIGVLAVFGDDTWAAGYEHDVRLSGTKFIFEGPGKDPFLVLDPDVAEEAAHAAVRAACFNSGQACTSPERFYVVSEAHDVFVEKAIAGVAELGPVGTLAPAVAKRVLDQVDDALARGATVHGDLDLREVAGRVLLSPTVLTGVDHTMKVMREETFGPLVPVRRVSSVDEAVTLAEDSPYGLSATVYGGDPAIHDRLARTHGQVFAGTTWLDNRVANPIAPYGGRKASGWVWAWQGDEFVRRDGPRSTLIEFTGQKRTS
jgi:acyl-CoA reductase-like NAD-dependent aldehyde dehydrogenase